ncbi:MAG: 4Fe-4S cluster-binding domain-containing protein [Clostridia bacterium]|nr:4Fe-4S cluster-binding domain-containing protein [Clostridia bacterium]MDE7328613.1 4Fe-4S cluster-binding domain-containing protein [Clostridia bacterium]
MEKCKARIDSIYNGSAVDGKGLRCVVFFTGCNMRCGFCHNPETWTEKGREVTLEEVVSKIIRYKSYIKNGGVTLSGGEPFLQANFCKALVNALHKEGISVIIETNGLICDEELIRLCDGVRLDIKNQDKDIDGRVFKFLDCCQKYDIPVTMTNVLVPTLNDGADKLSKLKELKEEYSCIKDFKFLAFRKLCESKYQRLNMPFPYEKYEEGSKSDLDKAYDFIKR